MARDSLVYIDVVDRGKRLDTHEIPLMGLTIRRRLGYITFVGEAGGEIDLDLDDFRWHFQELMDLINGVSKQLGHA